MISMRNRALALTAALTLTSLSVPALAQDEASPAAEATEAPATEAPTNPSAETAAGLLELLPETVADIPLETSTFEAASILANVESDALLLDMADLALEYDTELNRFAIAGAGGVTDESFVSIIGAQMPGVPAADLQEYFVSIVLGTTDPELTEPGTVAGQDVTVIRAGADAGPQNTAYLLEAGEVAWLVITDADNLEETITALATE